MSNNNGQMAIGMVERSYTLQSVAGGNGNGTAITLDANSHEVMIAVSGATAVLSVILEVSFDGGSNHENAFAEDLLAAGGIATLINTVANPTTHRYRYRVPPGATRLRARVASFVSGTVTVTGVVRSWR